MKKLYFIIFVFFAAVAGMYASDRQAGPEADTAAAGDAESFNIAMEKWEKLSDEEKEKLKKIYKEWKELPPQRRAWILMNHKRYKKMDDEEKEDLVEAYREWKRLSPNMKEKLKERYRAWKRLSPKQRYLIKKAYDKYQELSPMEKATVRHKVRNVSSEE